MAKRNKSFWLNLIIGAYLIVGSLYAFVTPVFEASDELWHYPMVRHLADGNPLPVQVFDPALAGPWKQEASQPPLYYFVSAALTFWIDTSDMETVRWENPHVDNGVITNDGNNNLIVHDLSLNRWQGTLLAVRMIRLFSVLMGACTVYLTYKIGKLTLPSRPDVVLGATAVLAFTPMFLFISGAVNNDNLIIPLAAWALYLMIWLVKRPVGNCTLFYWNIVTEKRFVLIYSAVLGGVIGLASLTKISGVGLFPLAFGTLVIYEWQQSKRLFTISNFAKSVLRALGWLLIVIVVAFAVAGWWYVRNVQLYDDWRGWSAFIAVLGQRAHPASLRQLWAERWGFMLSYWGLFGGVNVPMPLWIYHVFNAILVTAVVGFPLSIVQILRSEERRAKSEPLITNYYSLITRLFSTVERHFGFVICLLWSGAVVYGIVDWATITWSSQGRLVFSALPALTILMMTGLIGWLPFGIGQRVSKLIIGLFFLVALLAPFLWIRPAYVPQEKVLPEYAISVDAHFGENIKLGRYWVSYNNEREALMTPGDSFILETEWEVLAPIERNWSVFVHLNDPVIGQPLAQRDMYLGQGLLATSFLEPGQKVLNRYEIQIPKTAVSPAELELVIGLYDFNNWERLPTEAGDSLVLEKISLLSLSNVIPNATSINFEDEIQLSGFEMKNRRVPAGAVVELVLYLEALRPLTTDYTFFTQIVDEDTTRWAALDLQPTLPTSQWVPDQIQTVELQFQIRDDTPPDVYPLIIGMYTLTDANEFSRLQLIAEDGRLTDDFLPLTLIRIE